MRDWSVAVFMKYVSIVSCDFFKESCSYLFSSNISEYLSCFWSSKCRIWTAIYVSSCSVMFLFCSCFSSTFYFSASFAWSDNCALCYSCFYWLRIFICCIFSARDKSSLGITGLELRLAIAAGLWLGDAVAALSSWTSDDVGRTAIGGAGPIVEGARENCESRC